MSVLLARLVLSAAWPIGATHGQKSDLEEGTSNCKRSKTYGFVWKWAPFPIKWPLWGTPVMTNTHQITSIHQISAPTLPGVRTKWPAMHDGCVRKPFRNTLCRPMSVTAISSLAKTIKDWHPGAVRKACCITFFWKIHIIHHGIAYYFITMLCQPWPDVLNASSEDSPVQQVLQ